MKSEVLAYLAAVTNRYQRSKDNEEFFSLGIALEDISDLTDFIADIREIELKENDEIETLTYKFMKLKKILKETTENWKESYSRIAAENIRVKITLGQVENDLLVKEKQQKSAHKNYIAAQKCNEELKATNIMWQYSCKVLKEQNDKLKAKQKTRCGVDWEETCRTSWKENKKLREELAKLKGPQWKD